MLVLRNVGKAQKELIFSLTVVAFSLKQTLGRTTTVLVTQENLGKPYRAPKLASQRNSPPAEVRKRPIAPQKGKQWNLAELDHQKIQCSRPVILVLVGVSAGPWEGCNRRPFKSEFTKANSGAMHASRHDMAQNIPIPDISTVRGQLRMEWLHTSWSIQWKAGALAGCSGAFSPEKVNRSSRRQKYCPDTIIERECHPMRLIPHNDGFHFQWRGRDPLARQPVASQSVGIFQHDIYSSPSMSAFAVPWTSLAR